MTTEADLKKIAQLSDEELMKTTWDSLPSSEEEEEDPVVDPDKSTTLDPTEEEDPGNPKPDEEEVDPNPEEDEPEPGKKEEDEEDPASLDPELDPATQKPVDNSQEPKPEDKPKDGEPETETDYKALYEQIMSPIKASGKMIELKSPEEAIRLMQFGADYTRKMQALAPHRKALLMLENNGLLDEGKISYLIDLDKKNPEAIKKLIKESGLDVLELDTDKEPSYKAGNHKVTDEEVNLRTTLDDFRSTPEGEQFLKHVVDTWDQTSKGALWKNPEILTVIHEQKINGIYDRISGEIDRMRTLGSIPSTVPFLQAYKQVGDMLSEQGAFEDLVKPAPTTPVKEARKPVVTRTRPTEPAPANTEKARAAAATRSAPAPRVNELSKLAKASDDDFMKAMENITQ